MADKFPVTERTDVLPAENSFPRKKIREGWGAELSAANAPNTPSMEQAKHKRSVNLYTEYCDDNQNIYEGSDY